MIDSLSLLSALYLAFILIVCFCFSWHVPRWIGAEMERGRQAAIDQLTAEKAKRGQTR